MLFLQLGTILALATLFGIICHKFNQPLFFGYLLAGIMVGVFLPAANISAATLHFLSELGIAFLLFMVGLELHVADLRRLGGVVFIVAATQIIFMTSLGILVATWLGFSLGEGVIIGVALSCSSTIITVTWLNDSRSTHAVHGRVALGLLLIHDLIALVALMVISSVGQPGSSSHGLQVALWIFRGLTLLLGNVILSRYVVPKLFRLLAKAPELLFLGSIGWCVMLAAVTQMAGFSLEIGAFLAGIGLSSTNYQLQIASRIKPLRDFFVTLFFIILGLQLSTGNMLPALIPGLIFALLVAVVNPLIVAGVMGWRQYKRHTAFFTAVLFGQVGEFALVMAALAVSLHQLSSQGAALISVTVLCTMISSSYLTHHQELLYRRIRPLLGLFERRRTHATRSAQPMHRDHVVLLGCNRLGFELLTMMPRLETSVVVVDHNPDTIDVLRRTHVAVMYGDATDEDVWHEVGAAQSRLIISTIENHAATLRLLELYRATGCSIPLIVTAASKDEALAYYRLGAHYVIVPMYLGGEAVANLVQEQWLANRPFEHIRLDHLQSLTLRGMVQS